MTEEAYVPVSDMNGLGFKPFDLVIPFAVRKGEITGKPLQDLPCPLSAAPAAQNSAGEVILPYFRPGSFPSAPETGQPVSLKRWFVYNLHYILETCVSPQGRNFV